jgi:hypothetical protein
MTSEDSPDAITITDRPLSLFVSSLTLCAGFAAVVAVIPLHWFNHAPALAVAYVVLVTAAVFSICFRVWRMGLYMDGHGVTVRNIFWTHRFGWTEVSCFVNGSLLEVEGGAKMWAVRVVLRDGRGVTATGTAGAMGSMAKMTAIRRAAMKHGVQVDLHWPDAAGRRNTDLLN